MTQDELDTQAVTQYLSLKDVCIDCTAFDELISTVTQGIKDKCSISVEAAQEAHYELKALNRILHAIKCVEDNYINLTMNNISDDSK